MNQPPLNILSPEWGWDNIRRDVFQLVAWGYRRKEKEIRQRSLEEDITGLIRKGINETLDELDDDSWPRFQFYSAHNEDPVDDHDTSGKKRPRVDFQTKDARRDCCVDQGNGGAESALGSGTYSWRVAQAGYSRVQTHDSEIHEARSPPSPRRAEVGNLPPAIIMREKSGPVIFSRSPISSFVRSLRFSSSN
jgi:hypothetical protein